MASDKKRWNTKVVPDVPEPFVIGVTRACVTEYRRNPAHPAQLAPQLAIFTFDLCATTGLALRAVDETILSGTVSFRQSRYDGGGMRGLVSEVGSENLANPGFQQPRDRRARVHHVVPLTGTDPRKGAHL